MNATLIRLAAFGGGKSALGVLRLQIIFSIGFNGHRRASIQTIKVLNQMFFNNCVNLLAFIVPININ